MSAAAAAYNPLDPATLDVQRKARLLALWRWLVEECLTCDTCGSELATYGVEKELGDGKFLPDGRRCVKKRNGGQTTCLDRVRPLWSTRPA